MSFSWHRRSRRVVVTAFTEDRRILQQWNLDLTVGQRVPIPEGTRAVQVDDPRGSHGPAWSSGRNHVGREVERVNQPESISITELRKHASRYVAMAKAGQRVPITVRGELVAYLVPAHDFPTAAPGLTPIIATPTPSSPAAAPNAAE